jgi:hypothetical protein
METWLNNICNDHSVVSHNVLTWRRQRRCLDDSSTTNRQRVISTHTIYSPNIPVCCDSSSLWHSFIYINRPGILHPLLVSGGQFVTCDMTSTSSCTAPACYIISNLLCSKCGHFVTCHWYTWKCLRLISIGLTQCQNGACTLFTLECDRQFWVPIFSWYAYVPAFVYLCVLSQFLCSIFVLAPTLFICVGLFFCIKINAWNSQ